jgi:radical SAM superfamily enzyme YgiQ (UPF0313 family)
VRIAFVQPALSAFRSSGTIPPLAFGVLARLTPPEHEARLFDENVEALDTAWPCDCAALSVNTFNAKRAYRIAGQFRGRGVPVVMGGVHPTLLPDEALAHCDSVVLGDAEDVWPAVLRDLSAGRLRRMYKGDSERPPAGITPLRSIFRGKRYSRLAPVQFGRGCLFNCEFCSVHLLYGKRIRHRPVSEVLDEAAECKKEILFFVDDNLYSYGQAFYELLQGLSRLRARWVGQISVNAALDAKLVEAMRESGCCALFIGFETLTKENLHRMNKHQNADRDYSRAVRLLQENNIMVCGSFLFGYDADHAGSIRSALEFARENRLALAHFNPLFPAPGTPLYQRLLDEGRLYDPKWWDSHTFRYGDLPFTPKGISGKDIEEGCFNARRKFNTLGSIASRAFGRRANWYPPGHLGLFLYANLFSRRDIFKKQGVALG